MIIWLPIVVGVVVFLFIWWWLVDFADYVLPAVLGLVAAFGSVVLVVVVEISTREKAEKARLIQQCIDDGKKEYECRSLFHQNIQVVPVFIPRVHSR